MTAITSQPLNPQVVYVQTTTPSDLTEGKLWYNTTAKALYSSDGSSYSAMETDTSEIQSQLLETEINVLINSVASTSTLNDWDNMFIDLFTDADGQSGTVDTGNTTAIFTTKYVNGGNVTYEDDAENSNNTTSYVLAKTISSINTLVSDATNYMKSSNIAYPPMTCKYNYVYDDTSEEDVLQTIDSTNYTLRTYTNPSPAKSVNYIRVYIKSSESPGYCYEKLDVVNASITPSDLIVQTNAITVTTAQISHQLYCHNVIAGTGTITYDISFDNGSTWDTAQALNTKNPRGSTTGTQMILKINLSGVGIGNSATADDYGIMLFY